MPEPLCRRKVNNMYLLRKLVLVFALGVLFGGFCRPLAAETPNIVWILGEDICPDLSCYGTKGVKTPHLDRLAAEGVRYTRAFTTSPVCSTSRSAMMTGMYQNAIGANQHRTANKKPLPSHVIPFPFLLQKAGYHTGLMASRKLDLNFTHKSKDLFPGGDWKNAGDKPFMAQVTFANTHRTWKRYPSLPVDPKEVEVPPYYPDTPLVRRDIADGLGEMQKLDQLVGGVLKRLDDEGLADKTLVIFIGDHGRCQVRGKQFLYDSGVQVPLIIRWPGHIKPGTVSEDLVSSIDVTATVLAAAGVRVPKWMQGRDLFDEKTPKRDYVMLARDKMDATHDSMRGCRDKRFKYIDNLMPERAWCQLNEYKERSYPVLALLNVLHLKGELSEVQARFMKATKPEEELFDIVADPFETRNLAADPKYKADLERMRGVVMAWRKEIGDEGVSESFRKGGWSSKYPTRSLENWEKMLAQWEQRVMSPAGLGGGQGKKKNRKKAPRQKKAEEKKE
ncbi:MAG: sulfatase [Planctomycetes bacterium]|nr:sulfatase [Planctomycetota bacterium]